MSLGIWVARRSELLEETTKDIVVLAFWNLYEMDTRTFYLQRVVLLV